MNHGYCKNCWWWECRENLHFGNISKEFKEIWERQKGKPFPTTFGHCYMENSDLGPFKVTREDCYCPDYTNRKKEEKKSGTLEDWIKKQI